jgi:hypothetical protein
MYKNLVNEIAGVPTAISGWVNLMSEVIVSMMVDIYNANGWESTSRNAKIRDEETGEMKSTTLYKTEYIYDNKETLYYILKIGGYNKESDFMSSDLFNTLPMWRPKISITMIAGDDNAYNRELKNQSTVSAEFELDLLDTKLTKVGDKGVIKSTNFHLQKLLPVNYINENGFDDTLKKEILKTIKPIIAHELTHTYQTYQQLKSGGAPHYGKDTAYNIISNLDFFSKLDVKLWNDFLHLIYLHLSFEINARISEFYYRVKEENIETKEEFFNFLKKSSVWDVVMNLQSFNTENFIKSFDDSNYGLIKTLTLNSMGIDTNDSASTVKSLVNLWSEILEQLNVVHKKEFGVDFGLDKLPKQIKNNPTKFFKFFENRFHERAEKMKRKLHKIIIILDLK